MRNKKIVSLQKGQVVSPQEDMLDIKMGDFIQISLI